MTWESWSVLLLLPDAEGKLKYLNSWRGVCLSATCMLCVDYQRLFFTLWTTDVRENWRGCQNQHVFVLQRDSQNQYGGAWPMYSTSFPSVFIVNPSYLQSSFEMWPPRLL